MRQHTRYRQVVQPGMISGVAFVTAYEVETSRLVTEAKILDSARTTASVRQKPTAWTRASERFLEVLRRRTPVLLR